MIHLNNFSNIICLLSFEHVFSYLKESTFIVINSLFRKMNITHFLIYKIKTIKSSNRINIDISKK